jgi:hypothetical protein
MGGEEDQVVLEGVPERPRPARIGEQRPKVVEADEVRLAGRILRVKAEADGVDQRVDGKEGVDDHRRGEEDDDVGRPRRPVARVDRGGGGFSGRDGRGRAHGRFAIPQRFSSRAASAAGAARTSA